MPGKRRGRKKVRGRGQGQELKRLVASIVSSQGNRFIKELLRKKDLTIGATKSDFQRNLSSAIDQGTLTLEDIETWLRSVEGWGDQHAYLYRLSAPLIRDLTVANVRRRVTDAQLSRRWDAPTAQAFPDEPELTSISFNNSVLRLVWQEASEDWTAVPEKNRRQREGLDLFEYRAYRQVDRRAITRFEANVDTRLAGLFITYAMQGEQHQLAKNEAARVLGLLMDHRELERRQFDIPQVILRLDEQAVQGAGRQDASVRAQKSKLAAGGGYVEFASNSTDGAYADEPAILGVRQSVRNAQRGAFHGKYGTFTFGLGGDAEMKARQIRIQLFGEDNRVRFWPQMSSEEVWTIVHKLSECL